MRLHFEIESGKVRLSDRDDPHGRTFVLGDARVQYRGAAGFAVQYSTLAEVYAPDSVDVLMFLRDNT